MKTILSNYNFTPNWLKDYTEDYFIYDRSENRDFLKDFPQEKIRYVENKGSDIFDKFLWIIENYENLPQIVLLSKSNIFKYITEAEFDEVKDNKTFTPLLTQNHKEVICDSGMPEPGKPFSFYKDGMYHELNYPSYLKSHKTKDPIWCYLDTFYNFALVELLGIKDLKYIPFAPGSNYILPKENILKHSKDFYKELRSYLEWDKYPGEAMIIERGLFLLWKT